MPRKPKKQPLYASEADLCDHLMRAARQRGFLVHPETGGYDLLLVATKDSVGFEAGTQIGVEAKLRANVHVIWQAIPKMHGRRPHCFAILVPEADDIFIDVARHLKITVLEARWLDHQYKGDFSFVKWWVHETKQTCWVPGVEVEGARGGCPSPKRLTKWKLSAVSLGLLFEERGYLTTEDFTAASVDKTLFYKEEWFLPEREIVKVGKKREVRYKLDVSKRLPHLIYPEVAAALRKGKTA